MAKGKNLKKWIREQINKHMTTEQRVYDHLVCEIRKRFKSSRDLPSITEMSRALGMSHQRVQKSLRRMEEKALVNKIGATRDIRYVPNTEEFIGG